ncbi:MAG: hypothetical protein FJ308_12940, partial [Planctomycetes bacterium]|nr:hypothetical protein [Planctomycetota bacterium]
TKGSIWIVVAPHANPGDFRGLFATNAPNERDYTSGINFDLGPGPTLRWDMFNVEGRGFSGARNLSNKSFPFATLHTVEIRIDDNTDQIVFSIDGEERGRREWTSESISTEEWTLGARFYTNDPGAQQVRGHAACDIAEFLVFDSLLSQEQSKAIHDTLQKKHTKLAEAIASQLTPAVTMEPLIKHENPPVVQMLQPGFEVRRIPIEITNVNNVLIRDDGALITLGYNGDIHIVRDTDGDNLEDTATLFYKNQGALRGPIGMQLTSVNDPRGRGVFVASKGKVSLFVDKNGDDTSDEEIIVANGWEEIVQNVDAVGLAIGPDGWLYFGLGTTNYANAYLVDNSGQAHYDLKSDRGTIQRVSPDFSVRETVCTGVRFPIGIAFTRNGDLFCTDQEGATWLPNGNPFDELLHIEQGKHYGFPPRHPSFNPTVIDEPSVFDYGPQHQSTCGLVFNKPTADPGRFGPELWGDNAIVCGESRGKLWRTQLVPTAHGYVAQSQLIACLQMLTVDSCITPQGDLIVACHSGPPDWGTGPAGIGSLFKIRAVQTPVPRPIIAWANSPTELRIAFDNPLDPTRWNDVTKNLRVEFGTYVRAGDRYENLIPPYAVVQAQLLAPRRSVPVTGVGVSNDLRTLIVQVPKQRSVGHYAVSMPSTWSEDTPAEPNRIVQRPEMEVDFSNHGALAQWSPADSKEPTWKGWLPHINLDIAREMTQGSAGHDRFWQSIQHAGTLELESLLDLRDVLRPKVQPGAKIDYEWPQELVTLTLEVLDPQGATQEVALGRHPGAVLLDIDPSKKAIDNHLFQVLCRDSDASKLATIKIQIEKNAGAIGTAISMFTAESSTPRAIPLNRFRLPWVEEKEAAHASNENETAIAQLEGGNWGRGHKLFHSADVGCSKCHASPGSGAIPLIGPDLSNLLFRDYESNLRDIEQPSYAINPEFIGHQIRLDDGTVLTGVVRDRGENYLVGDATGKLTECAKNTVVEMVASKLSIMPTGLLEKLNSDQIRDLMTYLMKPAPRMPIEGPIAAPKMRTVAEVADVLRGSVKAIEPPRPIKIVLVAGPKDHGLAEHDYPAWLAQWGQLLSAADSTEIEVAWEFPSPEQLHSADALVFFQKGSWGGSRAEAMDAYFQRGGGAIYLHWAVNGDDQVSDFSKRIGLASWGGKIKFRHGPLKLLVRDTEHPIMRNIRELDLLDESYWLLTGDPKGIRLLATSDEDGAPQPQLWTYQPGNGRVFVSIPGHYSWTFDDPIFRTIVLRGMAWVADEPIDRFNDLVTLGARMTNGPQKGEEAKPE